MILSFVRTILLYLLLIGSVRLMGKRQLGQLEASELVVAMLVADLAAIPLQDGGTPLYAGVVPILTVLSAELILSCLAMKSVGLRRLLCGKPVILIENGRILQGNLRSTRITMDELSSKLREKDILDIRTVQFAILETNGNLSVFPFPKYAPATAKDAGVQASEQFLPVSIIEDGCLYRQNLRLAGKDEIWLRNTLGEYRATVAGTWLLTVDKADHVYWLGEEAEK